MGDAENFQQNVEMTVMEEEVFSLSRTIRNKACNLKLPLLTRNRGKLEQFIMLYKNMDKIRECLKH